jgi:hypothetical protein
LSFYFLWKRHFLFTPFWFKPTFSGTKVGRKTRPWRIHYSAGICAIYCAVATFVTILSIFLYVG